MGLSEQEKIELYARRLLKKNELEYKNSNFAELENHRNYLQSQFRNFSLGLSALTLVGTGLFIFFFSRSFNNLEDTITRQINKEAINYRIIETYRDTLEAQIFYYANGPEIENIIKENADTVVTKQLSNEIDSLTKNAIANSSKFISDQIRLELDPLIREAIANEESDISKEGLLKLINRSVENSAVWNWIEVDDSDKKEFDPRCEYKWICTDGDHNNITFYATSVGKKSIRSLTRSSYISVGHENKGRYTGDGKGGLILYKRCR